MPRSDYPGFELSRQSVTQNNISDLTTHGKKKRPDPVARNRGVCKINPGSDLHSHAVASAVSSAQRGLTSVFGMGTGVTPAEWPPGNLASQKWTGRKGIRAVDMD